MPGAKEFRKARGAAVKARTRLLTDTRKEIVRQLGEARDQVAKILAGQPTDYQRWSLPRLQAEIDQALGTFSQEAGAQISGAAGRAWELGQDLVDKPLEAAGFQVRSAMQAIDTRQLQAMRSFMTGRIKDIAVKAANGINSQLGLVVIGAQSPSGAIGAVTKILGEQSRKRATTIVRTELNRAFHVAAHERLKDAATKVPGMQKQWRKSGKRHPRLSHAAIDGQVQDVGRPFVLKGGSVKIMFPGDPRAPAGETINCGCTVLPHKSDWKVQHAGRLPDE